MNNVKPKPLTKREEAWLKRLQKTLDACPSKRLGFYTIGDPSVGVYDNRYEDIIYDIADEGGEFCNAVRDANAYICDITFPNPVESTAG